MIYGKTGETLEELSFSLVFAASFLGYFGEFLMSDQGPWSPKIPKIPRCIEIFHVNSAIFGVCLRNGPGFEQQLSYLRSVQMPAGLEKKLVWILGYRWI